jgi:TRAP transporter 4TM/12TM fusion protein
MVVVPALVRLSLALHVPHAYTAYPALKRSPRDRIPIQDWVFALVGAFCAAYLFLFYEELSGRAGAPTEFDLVVGVAGMILLLEATRRALGPPLMVVALVFLIYTFGGPHMPDVIAHKGASLSKTMSHQWLSTEGVFVFLFVLFGALLDKAGAGNYFIKVAFSLLGHMRGGPAKAAVVSSGMTGLISGSSIANVVTTGTFTIPLMKRVGFSAEKAGAVEVASSTNGQLTPPIMGAAAFLMVEYVGISYVEVIKHAFLPAIISYIALVYIVHLEALKANMQGLPRRRVSTFTQTLISFGLTIAGLVIVSAVVYYGLGWIKTVAGPASPWIAALLTMIAYIGLLWYGCRFPPLEIDDPNSEVVELPEPGPTIKSGLHFLLPVVVLVWCLTVERFSPGLSAFWATVFMMFIVVSQRPMTAFFRRSGEQFSTAFRDGLIDLFEGLVSGARNMIGIGVATAAAGIVVGTVTLTGIGLVMTEFVEFISAGNLILMLVFTAVISLILGMGLPTTANYIVVSTLMAPVIVTLGAQAGLIVPLIAVHMFVFYFGILADDTPPVGLAAFAAAAISGGDPIRTGLQGFTYDIRTAILPFLFIFNTQLLMIGIETWYEFVLVVASAVLPRPKGFSWSRAAYGSPWRWSWSPSPFSGRASGGTWPTRPWSSPSRRASSHWPRAYRPTVSCVFRPRARP